MTPADLQALYDQLGTQQRLALRLGMSTRDISRYLRERGIQPHQRGGARRKAQITRTPSQIVNSAESRANGDAAVRARWTPRKPCPHGIVREGKPLPCTLVDAGCDPVSCVGSRSAEGRVSVASSFGREAVVQGGMR